MNSQSPTPPNKVKKALLKILKILAWGFASIILLFLIITILLQFPSIQTRIIQTITSTLSERVSTVVEIDRVAIRFPKSVGLKGIYLEDEKGDTLLYAGSIFVDVGMLGLLRNKVNVNSLEIKNLTGNMLRSEPDTVYNYQFLIDAFAASDTAKRETPVAEETAKSDAGSWKVNIDKVALENIHFRMLDHFTGLELISSLDKFNTRLNKADLLSGRYHIGNTTFSGVSVEINMSPRGVAAIPKVRDGLPVLDIFTGSIAVEDISFLFTSFDGTHMDIGSKTLKLTPDKISLHEFIVDLQELEVAELVANFDFPARKKEQDLLAQDPESPKQALHFSFSEIMEWNVTLGNLNISNSAFSMVQGAAENTPGAFNPSNINLQNINIKAQELEVSPQSLKINLANLSAAFTDEFMLRNLSGNIDLGSQSKIDQLLLVTGNSQLGFSLQSDGSFLEFDTDKLMAYDFELQFQESSLQSDLSYLVEAMNQYYFNWPGNQGIKLGGQLRGQIPDMQIDSLWFTGPDFFSTYIIADIKGLPLPEEIFVDIKDFKFFAAPKKFFTNLPDSLTPEAIELPQYVYMQNKSRGSLRDFKTIVDVQSDLGNMAFKGDIKEDADSITHFTGTFQALAFQVGKLLKQTDQLPEPIDLDFTFEGTGREPENMNLQARLNLRNLTYQQHSYEEIGVNLELKDSIAMLNSRYEDELLSFDLDASYGAFQENPNLNAQLELDYARLKELGLGSRDILVKTSLNAGLTFDMEDFFNGTVNISNTSIASEGEIYTIPSITLQAFALPENYAFKLQSSFASADFQGNFSPVEIPAILSSHFSHYFTLGLQQEIADSTQAKQFKLIVHIIPDEFIADLVLPNLSRSDTLSLTLDYNSLRSDIILEANLSTASYGTFDLRNFRANIISDDASLGFEVMLEEFTFNDINLREFNVQGNFANEVLDVSFAFKDTDLSPLYMLSASMEKSDSMYFLHIKDQDMLINGEDWNIQPQNRVAFGPEYIQFDNFRLESNDRALFVQSSIDDQENTIIDISLRQIDMGRLTSFTAGQTPPIGGLFNGNLSLRNIFDKPAFLADLTIDNLSYDGDTLGNLVLKAENPVQDRYDLHASLTSELTDLLVTGNYRTGEQQEIDFDIDLKRLDLPSFESLAEGNISDLKGYLSGRMSLSGTTEAPRVSGNLDINETAFTVLALNSEFFIHNERITFDRTHIRFPDLALEDSAGRKANISGSINFADLNELVFNVDLNSRNFLLMNARPGQNEMYHGRVLMDTDLRLRGSQNNPNIEGRVKLNEGSNFTITLPQSIPEAIGDEGVVEFVQTRDTLFYQMAKLTDEPSEMRSSFETLDMSVNIEIDDNTDVRIIIDKYAGDFLEIQGGGLFSFGIDPGGRITLSGRYEIVQGEYLLTFYDIIRRNFLIQSGSNIIWTGDPMQARIDMTAIHTVRTSARDLMADQVSDDQSGALRQQYPFQVYLKMRGNLMEPDIRFELDMPQEHQNAMDGSIMARINQINQNESELNKQVFALLMLGNFIQENPFASLGGNGISSTARSSASQILTQQLNRLSERYIKGLDLNFEVESYEDFTDGQQTGRTELQLEVSQNFFNERVKVTVGGNIELEDEATRQREATDIAGDFAIEYLITPDGNLKLKGFRSKNYADIFDGQVIETGVAIMFSRSYNRFKELFTRKEKDADIVNEDEQEQENEEE